MNWKWRARLRDWGTLAAAVAKVYGPIALLIAAGFYVAFRFVAPPPPDTLRFAAGAEGGSYAAFAERYAQILARDGVKLEILRTGGALDNLHMLSGGENRADAGFVQGGVGSEEGSPGGAVLATVFHEPGWLMVRADLRVTKLADMRGRRIAIGPEGSGTQILARQLLRANGFDMASDVQAVAMGTGDALVALRERRIDAAFAVSARPPEGLADMLASGRARLIGFPRHEAYKHNFPFLASVVLPGGSLDLARDVPNEDLVLLAPVAQLAVREDLHPALVQLLFKAAEDVHSPRQLFAPPGMFPSLDYLDFPEHEDSERLVRRGPGVLVAYLTFWVAVLIERTLVMLIPLITLMIPLMRLAPPIYRWQIRGKINRWYKRLRTIEVRLLNESDPTARESCRAELSSIEKAVESLKLPHSYDDALYQLRMHVRFVREKVAGDQ
ncbi:MAG: TAXI family TRAP transporter solute-binding subunit [Alphaproteobacteria bacterium]|nr:TAXI family TRAP transporter solute-binding subunit [Alphaproteobacteria bacterium]